MITPGNSTLFLIDPQENSLAATFSLPLEILYPSQRPYLNFSGIIVAPKLRGQI